MNSLSGSWKIAVASIAIFWSIFQLLTGRFQFLTMNQNLIHVACGFTMIFLLYPFSKHFKKEGRPSIEGIISASLVIIICFYIFINWKHRESGMEPPLSDLILGGILIWLILDGSRRVIGPFFSIITFIFLIYSRFGEYFPNILSHRNFEYGQIINGLFMFTEGIFGMLTSISATYIYIFVLFGSFVQMSGAGDFLMDLATAILGRFRGGPGKCAVIASCLFGMISGSAVANVAVDGPITINLMKRTGFRSHIAGAIEATASTGGQIMPPVLGGSAFVMMEVLGVSYIYICKSILLIALLYYLGLFIVVDYEAAKLGLRGLPKEDLPKLHKVLAKGWFYSIPLFVLLFFLVGLHTSPQRAAFWGVISIPFSTLFSKRGSRMSFKQMKNGLEDAAHTMLPVVGVVVCASILITMVNITGFGLMLSQILITLSGKSLLLLAFLAAIVALILGMGSPTICAYIVLAILVCPAMVGMGVKPIIAHLFIFFYAVIANITPPVAPAAYVAAGIAHASMTKTGFAAFRLVLPVLFIPFFALYSPAIILEGNWWEIVQVCITSILGVWALTAAIQGYLFKDINILLRLLVGLGGLCLIVPETITDIVGGIIFLSVVVYEKIRLRKEERIGALIAPVSPVLNGGLDPGKKVEPYRDV